MNLDEQIQDESKHERLAGLHKQMSVLLKQQRRLRVLGKKGAGRLKLRIEAFHSTDTDASALGLKPSSIYPQPIELEGGYVEGEGAMCLEVLTTLSRAVSLQIEDCKQLIDNESKATSRDKKS